MAMSSLAYIYSGVFREIFLSANLYRLCKLDIWRVELSDTILKWDYPRTIPARFGLIWFRGFRGKDLNVIFYQNMSNLYNQYKSVERKNSQKNPEYMLIYSLTCSCS
jgi:hypothetical protein